MQLVETHILNTPEIEDVCVKAKLLYNQSLYYLRQSLFGNIEKFTEYELTGLFAKYNEETFRALPSMTAQQTVKLLFKNWKSYFAAIKGWKKDPSKYLGKPQLPKYKNKTSIVIFTGQGQVSLKNGYINFPKKTNIPPIKTNAPNLCQVRIIPLPNTFKIEIIYEKEITDLKLSKENIISLDLGLNNMCASTNNVGLPPFIINGKPIKAFNQWYNKEKSKLQSFLPNSRYISERITKLAHYRNCWIEDKIHKASRYIIDYCIENNIGTIVIGKNDGWKNDINIGSKNNQHFVNIPHAKLIDKIVYKGGLVGINVIKTEESYTSKIDHLAFEPLRKQESYLGKRVKRGLFKSSTGMFFNADGNGSLGIGRKVFGDDFVKNIANSRQAFCHYKVNIL